MNDAPSSMLGRAADLRFAFDRSFAMKRRADTAASEDLLAIRLGSEAYALRLSEIAGLFADKKITRVPGRNAGLLGIAGFRGAIVPVYDLQTLLGATAMEVPRWLVIASAAPVAFAFDAFDGHLRIAHDAMLPQETGEHARKYVREFLRMGSAVRPILHLPSILDAVMRQVSDESPREER